jgi:hypothetical protein
LKDAARYLKDFISKNQKSNTMQKSESIKNITQAIVKVMAEVKGIEENSRIGKGSTSYKGIKDKDVKIAFNEAFTKNGLAIVPTGIEEHTELGAKQLLTKVVTTYLLMHTSGEFIELKGYGHGKDFADKGAGKATTYALKYCLLYTFLTPKGDIDDTDTTHSNAYKTPQKQQPKKQTEFKQVTTNVVLKWKGGPFYKVNGKDCIYVDNVAYWMTEEQAERLKADKRYKDS